MSNSDNFARDLVAREVVVCVSSLVHTLAQSYGVDGGLPRDLRELTEQAGELCYPIEDHEEAAIQAGWHYSATHDAWISDNHAAMCADPQEVCEELGIEPYQWEIFEHWAVTRWLGEQLQEAGERVDFDFSGMVVWGRTTSGQAIYCDSVIQELARKLQEAR